MVFYHAVINERNIVNRFYDIDLRIYNQRKKLVTSFTIYHFHTWSLFVYKKQ